MKIVKIKNANYHTRTKILNEIIDNYHYNYMREKERKRTDFFP